MSSRLESGAAVEEVRERLDRVTDPELDESIVALGYIDEIRIDGDRAYVEFTLPTAWCSPAFAWMMATDARKEAESLPEIEKASVRLREHLHETEITEGVTEDRTFGEVFPDADGGVEEVRAALDEKARLARQYRAIESLLEAGVAPEQVIELEPTDIWLDDPAAVFLAERAFAVSVPYEPISAYLEKARETGVIADEHEALFRTPEGEPISPGRFETVQKRTRSTAVNMTGQGSVCDALHEARRDPDRPPLSEL